MTRPAPSSAERSARIQPVGFLVGLAPDWRIIRASANFGDYVADAGGSPLDRPLADLLGEAAVHALRNRMALLRDPHGAARLFALHTAGTTKPLDIMMHLAGGETILEAQPATGLESGDPIGLVRQLATRLDEHDQLDGMLGEAARQFRALTGFETVSLFRWTNDGTAELAAHCARSDHGAAPRPARKGARARLVFDAGATNIAISPEPAPALLARCLFQSRGHDEREEMGAAASLMRLPIESSGAEWGVTVCLNSSPRLLGLERFAIAELFSDLLALRIALHESTGQTAAERV